MKKYLFLFGFLLLFLISYSQECDYFIERAHESYSKADYNKAAQYYKFIIDEKICGENSKYFQTELNKCLAMAEEDRCYGMCKTIEGCDKYLNKYPKGRYVAQVNKKRNEIITAQYDTEIMRAREDAMYERCSTEADCEEYLITYPKGRYVSKVRIMKNELEKQRLLIEREASKTAYMNIHKIEFANADADRNIINQYGFTLYASEIRFLMPRITYDGILDELRYVVIYSKIINPNGSIQTSNNSPSGYTFSNSFLVEPGMGNTYELTCWGNSEGKSFVSGDYQYEVWYEGHCIYQTSFTIKERENALSLGFWRNALRKCSEYSTQDFGNGSYKGQIDNNIRSGLGMYLYDSGCCYIGNWRSNFWKGVGIYFTAHGYIKNCPQCVYYVGEWARINNKNGEGSCYDRLGNLIYRGTFVNDKPTNAYPITNNDIYKFECIQYSDGQYYVGETKNGVYHGKGMIIWKNGDMWFGDFIDGKKDGYGIYMLYQGSVSEEIWRNGIKQ